MFDYCYGQSINYITWHAGVELKYLLKGLNVSAFPVDYFHAGIV